MKITKMLEGTNLTITLEGRLDTTTAPEFEKEARGAISGATLLVIDMKGLDYISSAGLRALLALQKIMNVQGKMIVKNANEVVREVFDVTGFVDILTLE